MHTDQDLPVFIRVHLGLYFLSALTRPLITVGSSAWSAEFGVYEPFDAEQGAARAEKSSGRWNRGDTP